MSVIFFRKKEGFYSGKHKAPVGNTGGGLDNTALGNDENLK